METLIKQYRQLNGLMAMRGLNVITTITKFNVDHLLGLVKFLHSKEDKTKYLLSELMNL